MSADDPDACPPFIAVTADALARLNGQPRDTSFALFLRCSHSAHWARFMLDRMPFTDALALSRCAHEGWQCASENDWHDAFAGHPKIGDVEYLRKRFDTRAIGEQGQLLEAPEDLIEELARLNTEYQARHGFIFIVCAHGLGAQQMVQALQARLPRPREVEFAEAANQHAAINRLRLTEALRA